MFCYTIAQSYQCIIREMLMWSNTSKEHPTFIMTVAELSNKPLGAAVEEELVRIHNVFEMIEQETRKLEPMLTSYQGYYMVRARLQELIRHFLHHNPHFISLLERLQRQSQEPADAVWQVLLEHIQDEQRYMQRLLSTLLSQIG